MIEAKSFSGRHVGVFGLARSGLSAAQALRRGGARVFAWDDRGSARASAQAQGDFCTPWQGWPWATLAAVVLSPGIPLTHPKPHAVVRQATRAGVEVIGDVELFARTIGGKAPVIAVTGTNGKSTTTALIGHVLRRTGFDAQVGGNIGCPVLELDMPGERTVYVLEVSSYQIDLAPGLRPDVALLTNLSPDHIDRHGTMENYAAVKAALLKRARSVVVGVDDPYSAKIHAELRGDNTIPVSVGRSLERGVYVLGGELFDACDGTAAKLGDLKSAAHLPGAHNWQNAALAYAAVRSRVRDLKAVFDAILSFPGLAHRIEEVGRIGRVRFVNDSKATNADAASRALACFDNIFWIAGGKPKEGGIADLAPFFPRIARAYLIGEAAGQFSATLAGKVDASQCGTLERALSQAYADASRSTAADPVVLLSPACASFDQFRDFEHRGDVFRAAVQAMMLAERRKERA